VIAVRCPVRPRHRWRRFSVPQAGGRSVAVSAPRTVTPIGAATRLARPISSADGRGTRGRGDRFRGRHHGWTARCGIGLPRRQDSHPQRARATIARAASGSAAHLRSVSARLSCWFSAKTKRRGRRSRPERPNVERRAGTCRGRSSSRRSTGSATTTTGFALRSRNPLPVLPEVTSAELPLGIRRTLCMGRRLDR